MDDFDDFQLVFSPPQHQQNAIFSGTDFELVNTYMVDHIYTKELMTGPLPMI